jgi:hypothetical protein
MQKNVFLAKDGVNYELSITRLSVYATASFSKIFRSPEYKVAGIDQRFAKININHGNTTCIRLK